MLDSQLPVILGPSVVNTTHAEDVADVDEGRTKKLKLAVDQVILDEIPNTSKYEYSLMHKDELISVIIHKSLLITISSDSIIKFWKIQIEKLEFIKSFKLHSKAFSNIVHDSSRLVSSCGNELKVVDLGNQDMIDIIKLDFIPSKLCLSHNILLATNDHSLLEINLLDSDNSNQKSINARVIEERKNEIILMSKHRCGVYIIVESQGIIDYLMIDAKKLPPIVKFTVKPVDLYVFKRSNMRPSALTFNRLQTLFAIRSLNTIVVFHFDTGKILLKYDDTFNQTQLDQFGMKINQMDLQKRLSIESSITNQNVIFDNSSKYILFPTMLGIKVVDISSGVVIRIIGRTENIRFNQIQLYQGAPSKKSIVTIEMLSSENTALRESEIVDPLLVCTAIGKKRFFCFTNREPDSSSDISRDVYNEKPSKEEQLIATSDTYETSAIIHTTFGDIYLRLFPEFSPKAVENFALLARKGYYDNILFHRCIKGFMIQTGDPLGDGTGGQSIWGRNFEDEVVLDLRHDRPYTLSMANSGINTNGSQFFITTAPTPWLDDKHTIFGRCVGGMDVIHRIEHSKVDKHDRPLEAVKIIQVELR